MIDEKKIKEFRKRRGDRFDSAYEKIKMYSDDCSFYYNKTGKTYIKKAVEIFKKNTLREHLGSKNETTYLRYLKGDSTEVIDEIIENLREGNIYFIESDLTNSKKELNANFIKNNIDKIEEKYRDKYFHAVDLLIHLEKIGRIDELEENLTELNKDLVSCIKYNNMIEKELEKGE